MFQKYHLRLKLSQMRLFRISKIPNQCRIGKMKKLIPRRPTTGMSSPKTCGKITSSLRATQIGTRQFRKSRMVGLKPSRLNHPILQKKAREHWIPLFQS